MQIQIGAVSVTTSFGWKGRVAAFDYAFVHKLEVHVLKMGFHTEMVLEYLTTRRALTGVVFVQGHIPGRDERTVLVVAVLAVLV